MQGNSITTVGGWESDVHERCASHSRATVKERGARTQPWVCLTPRGQKDSDNNDDTGHQLMSLESGTEPGTWHFLSSYSLLTAKKGKVLAGVDREVCGAPWGRRLDQGREL